MGTTMSLPELPPAPPAMMDTESINWFRLAKLFTDVGPNVLRRYLQMLVLTSCPCLCDLSSHWLKNVHNPAGINYLSLLKTKLTHDLQNVRDMNSRQKLKKILNGLSTGKPLSLTMQMHKLMEWEEDIQKMLHSASDLEIGTLVSWWKKTQIEKDAVSTLYRILKGWTNNFFSLLNETQQKLYISVQSCHDDFLFICQTSLSSVRKRSTLKHRIKNLRISARENLETCENEHIQLLTSWKQRLQDELNSWEKAMDPNIPYNYVLQFFLTEIKNAMKNICSIELHDTCSTWHQELEGLFTKWLESHDDMNELSDEFENYPTFSNQQIEQFFKPLMVQYTLNRSLFPDHSSRLHLSSWYPDLNKCDSTLLIQILTNVPNLLVQPPDLGWNENISHRDTSVGAAIMRFRSLRNSVFAHIAKGKILTGDYISLFNEVENILFLIAFNCSNEFKSEVEEEIRMLRECAIETGGSDLRLQINKYKDLLLVDVPELPTEFFQCMADVAPILNNLSTEAERPDEIICPTCGTKAKPDPHLTAEIRNWSKRGYESGKERAGLVGALAGGTAGALKGWYIGMTTEKANAK